jgi:hypothetical protein
LSLDRTYLGRELSLGFVADDAGRFAAGPFSNVDLVAIVREDALPRSYDLGLVDGRAALVQALIMRLMTERGELARLGHADYGSRHHQLVGEPNVEGNRSLLKLYILECLHQEQRLQQIMNVTVSPIAGRDNREKVAVGITVLMKGVPDPLSFVVPFSFGGPF